MFYAPTPRAARFAPRTFDRGFERFVNEAFAGTGRALRVEQDETSWTFSLDVPGLSREDLNIGIEGAVVRIDSKPEAGRRFNAAYELPQEIDVVSSTAKLEHGVLTLKLGKLASVTNVTQLKIE